MIFFCLLQKVLGTHDLISLGVGSCAGTGMYLVSGMVAKTIAGPAVVLSYTIAGLAALLSALCYAELGVRVPHTTGSAYVYTYVTVGEFVAFIIGKTFICIFFCSKIQIRIWRRGIHITYPYHGPCFFRLEHDFGVHHRHRFLCMRAFGLL